MTIEKLVNIECNYNGNMAVTCDSLFLTREILYRVNSKDVRYGEKHFCAWSLMLCFTSLKKYYIEMWNNKRNMATEKIGV